MRVQSIIHDRFADQVADVRSGAIDPARESAAKRLDREWLSQTEPFAREARKSGPNFILRAP